MTSTLFVCVSCRGSTEATSSEGVRPGALLLQALERQCAAEGADLDIVPIECLSNCQRGCSVAVSAMGKWTYVVGGLDPDVHAADVVRFACQHRAHAEGLPVWRERPVYIRKNVIARVPPLPLKDPP